jgi:hypothetical protein
MLPGIDGIVGIAPPKAHPVDFDFSSKTLSWNRWSDPEAIGIRDKCVNVALRITYSSWTASPPG